MGVIFHLVFLSRRLESLLVSLPSTELASTRVVSGRAGDGFLESLLSMGILYFKELEMGLF